MLIFIFFVATVGIIVALIIESRVDKEMEKRREILINQVKSVCLESDTRFSVSGHFDRMERESQRIRDEIKSKEPYVLVLWWGDDGLRLNADGTTEWIDKRPHPQPFRYDPNVLELTTLDDTTLRICQTTAQLTTTIQQLEMQLAQQAQNAAIIGSMKTIPYPQWVTAYPCSCSPYQYQCLQGNNLI